MSDRQSRLRPPTRGQLLVLLGVLVVTMLGVVAMGLLAAGPTPDGAGTGTRAGAGTRAGTGVGASATPRSNLPGVAVADLPPQARDTLALIDHGGPYPFSQDNTVFSNAEQVLPDRARGYYREYTVVSPGVSSRGTRRLVVGALGDTYYTADHYVSFRQVLR